MGSILRSVGVLALVFSAACGDDGIHHLADAPNSPDVPIDVPTDAPIDAPANVDLTVTLSGNGNGTVTSSVGGIDCGTTCADDYPPNTMVTLTAEPGVGSVFTGWAGGCTGTQPTCEVTIAQATSVTATFTLQTFTVTVGKVGVGTGTVMGSGINCGADCTEVVDYGTSITLTAAPLALSTFIGWGGPCTGTTMCTTTITANTAITAAFGLDDISMNVAKAGNGSGTVTSAPAGINCGADCDQIYVANTMVTLTAAAATGSTFTGWSGAGCSGTGTCTVTMTAAVLVTATFTLNTFQVDVVKAGNGTGTVTSAPAGIACGGDCDETYNYNTVVTLTAAAGAGSNFAGWTGGGCSGTGTCVVTVTAATSVTATFSLNQYLLSATVGGTGSGTVTSTPAGITCGADCNQLYNHGTMVSLAASPAAGSTFTGWGGACSGTGACMVTMTTAASVTATFTLNTYALTVSLAGNGAGSVASAPAGIACGADCTETYGHGTMVTLTPTAMVGSTFTGWAGACSGTGACVVTMTAASAVTATFTLNTFALTVAKTGNGFGTVTSAPAGINCGGDCTETYNFGQMVTLSQSASAGSSFTGWSGACSGTGSCIVTMDAVKSVTATFTLDTLTLTVATAGTGTGSVASTPAGIACGADCTETYNFGTIVTLTPTATASSTFTGWSGACSGTGACMVTMDAAKSVTATFTLKTYLLTAATMGTGAGTITSTPAGISCGIDCTETYNHGTSVTLTQAATTGSTFTGWGGACSGTGACTVSMTAAQSVTATFTLNSYALAVTKPGTGSGTVTSTPAGITCGGDCNETYSHGTVVMLTQSATTGSTFTGWGGACSGTGTCTVTMDAAKSVSANFTINSYTLSTTVTGTGTVTSSPTGISCPGDCNESYTHGTSVTLTQSAGTGYTFTGWGGACSGTGACTVSMTAAQMVTATFMINSYALSTTVTGTGTVTSTPAGISCPGDCGQNYTHGTSVTLTQSAGTGYTFTGWGGACSGSGACTVSMTAAQMVTATFTINSYLLMVSKLGTGTGTVTSAPAGISCGSDCMEAYNHGTSVVLTATPTAGSVFTGWTGACSGTGSCTVSMTAAQSVTATFDIATYTLTVVHGSIAGGSGLVKDQFGGISCPTNCTEVYTAGTSVTLSATPDPASNFIGWSGVSCPGFGDCKIDMTSNITVTAQFSAPNIMFVTSKPYGGNFASNSGGRPQDYADNECQLAAQSAGLVGTGPGRNLTFRAWISTFSSNQGGQIDAKSRFDGSAGWIRPGDWKPIINSIGDIGSSKVWYPPRRNEAGNDEGSGPGLQVWTSTDENGVYTGDSCFEGASYNTSTAGLFATVGLASATGSPISTWDKLGCNTPRRFLCMGMGRDTKVGAPPVQGRLAFTTNGTWAPSASGIDTADALCNTEASGANLPGTYRALLAPQGFTAMSRFTQTGVPWVRVGDLQPIATTDAALFTATVTTLLNVAPNATATGTRIGNVTAHTGATAVTTNGGAGGTCSDWKDPLDAKAIFGLPFDTGMRTYFFNAQTGAPCGTPRRVVCLQR